MGETNQSRKERNQKFKIESDQRKYLKRAFKLKNGIEGLRTILNHYKETNAMMGKAGGYIQGVGKVNEMEYVLSEIEKEFLKK